MEGGWGATAWVREIVGGLGLNYLLVFDSGIQVMYRGGREGKLDRERRKRQNIGRSIS